MGLIGCPETSVQNYHTTLRNIPEQHRSHLHRGGSLELRKLNLLVDVLYFCSKRTSSQWLTVIEMHITMNKISQHTHCNCRYFLVYKTRSFFYILKYPKSRGPLYIWRRLIIYVNKLYATRNRQGKLRPSHTGHRTANGILVFLRNSVLKNVVCIGDNV